MIVPSRSRKTAGAVSLDETVILKAGDQFLARHRGGAKFADDHGAAVIGNFGGLARCGLTTKRERKERNRGVARPRNVENLAGFGGNVMRLIFFLKKHHALFPQRNKQKPGVPFIKKGFAGLEERVVFVR